MDNQDSYLAFLDIWHDAMWYLFLAGIGLAVLLLLVYQIRYWSASGYKSKYELASQYEIKNYLRVNYILAAGIFFFLNTVYDETVVLSPVWFFIRAFISFCIATLHVYIAYLVFKYYYPGPLEKKLKRLRYTPRINPATGNKMNLLSEDEEDSYLDEGMQAEEDAFSVDYDVWMDPITGETKIEKYKGHLSALECDRCGFQTLKLQKEEILKEATDIEDGEIEKEYLCSYCGRVKRKTVKLTTRIDKDPARSHHGHVVADPLKNDKRISLIKVEVHSGGGAKIFEFQNIEQAKNFLQEFDFEKLQEKSY